MKIVLSSYPTLAVSLACFSGRDPIFFLFLSCIFFFMTSLWWFFLESICCFRSAWRSTVSRLISSFSSLPEVVEQLCKLKKFKKYHYYNVTITKWNIRELQNLYQAVKNKSFQHSQIGTFQQNRPPKTHSKSHQPHIGPGQSPPSPVSSTPYPLLAGVTVPCLPGVGPARSDLLRRKFSSLVV